MKDYTLSDQIAGYLFMAILILPLLYGLYLEYKRQREEGKGK